MVFWGEAEMLWANAITELLRWRRQRRALEASAAALVAETEEFLAGLAGGRLQPPPGGEPPARP